jgi:hypothetical protein
MEREQKKIPKVFELNRYHAVVPCPKMELNPLSLLGGEDIFV